MFENNTFEDRRRIFGAYSKLDELLQSNGFKQLPLGTLISPNIESKLVGEHETIYNRSEGSNYFVFVKIEDDKLKVTYTNPDYSDNAIKLPLNKVWPLHVTTGNNDKWYSTTINAILKAASRKPKDKYFAKLHGHWGEINGVDLNKENIDDGQSSEYEIIRNLMLYNFDIDATGSHNHFNIGLMTHVKILEESVGITKIPGIELTLPSDDDMNGPHLNVWFSNFDVAQKYAERILKKRKGEYPPFAPDISTKEVLEYHKNGFLDKSLAVGLAHCFSDKNLPGVGLGNRIAKGDYTAEKAIDFISENITAVEIFNCGTPPNQEIEFSRKEDEMYFRNILENFGLKEVKLSPTILSWAIAKHFRKEGKWTYVGHDTHKYFDIGYDKNRRISRPGRGTTIMDLSNLESVKSGKKPTSEEILNLMHDTYARSNIVTFVPQILDSNGTLDIVPARKDNTLVNKLAIKTSKINMYAKMLPTFISDFIDNGIDVVK
ncbi:MAG: hypothetical protein ACP5N1_04480 [Candidatus Woesearchaeota archaeon]